MERLLKFANEDLIMELLPIIDNFERAIKLESSDNNLMDGVKMIHKSLLNALEKYEESNLFLRGIIPSMGFSYTTIEYDEKPRLAGESKYSLRKMIQLAATGITSFSVRPLHFIFFCGIFFFLVSIVMLI